MVVERKWYSGAMFNENNVNTKITFQLVGKGSPASKLCKIKYYALERTHISKYSSLTLSLKWELMSAKNLKSQGPSDSYPFLVVFQQLFMILSR